MAASVLLACGLNERKLSPHVHISEESGADGSFLISSILGQRIRIQESGIVLVCMHHTYEHYFNAGMRLGYNLNIARGKSLYVIEPIDDIADALFDSKWLRSEEEILKHLWEDIEQNVNKAVEGKQSVTLVIDDLSALLNLGATEAGLIKFCLALNKKSNLNEKVTVITKLNCSDIFELITNNLKDLCDIDINVEKFKSGNFREVDGKIITHRKTVEENFEIKRTSKTILFKVNEKNIKIFNPGEVGIQI